jgi:CrcB protein
VTVLLVAVGGAAGSVLRYLTDRRVQRWRSSPFPWGTLTVNVAGSLVLGFLTGLLLRGAEPSPVRSLVAIGFCGGLTTFSTFGYETVRLFFEKARRLAVLNAVVTILAGLASGTSGLLLATAVRS